MANALLKVKCYYNSKKNVKRFRNQSAEALDLDQ
jgi:hypothetical protein